MTHAKTYETASTFVKVIHRKLLASFFRTRCRNISVFSRWPENCPRVSDVVLISGGRLFHANGPATEKLRGLKTAVLVCGATRSGTPNDATHSAVMRLHVVCPPACP